MKLMSFARNKVFWLLDSIKGSNVKIAYDNIKKIDSLNSDAPYIKEHQDAAWIKLKQNACSKTKAYEPYKSHEFFKFPIITKQDIRQAQDDFISSDYNKEQLITMPTSGSTGTPFVCYQNRGKKFRVNAEVIYYCEKIGYTLGENMSYVRTIVRQIKKSALKQFMQNQTMINCGLLNDSGIETILKIIKKRSKTGPVILLAYGSTYTAIKNYFLKHNITEFSALNISGAVSGSDMLFDDTREVISKVFGNIPVVSRYSNEENGVIGQDEGVNNVFTINEADYIVEIVDEQGNNVPDGTIGRIVVTDLFNYAMPMIRYDTGDIGAIQTFEINGRKKRCICDFSGRRVDVIFDTDGNALSPHSITNSMWSFTDITQFQVIQTDKNKYTLKLNVDGVFNREDEVVDELQSILGQNALIQIEKVDEIPVLSSGKRRYIINEWQKQ